jgi:hypothetical protein
MDFDQVEANINQAERLFRERGLERWAWTQEVKEAVLDGRVPDRIEPPGEPIVMVEGARRLSSYAGFVNLRMEVAGMRQQARLTAARELGMKAHQRIGEIVREAARLVEQLLPLSEEATRAYRAWADWQQAQVTASPPQPDPHGGGSYAIQRGPVEPGTRPHEGISAADLVAAVLDPTIDLLVFERVVPQGMRTSVEFVREQARPEPEVEVSARLRAAYAQAPRMQRTPPRLVPGIRVRDQKPTNDDGSTGEPEAS